MLLTAEIFDHCKAVVCGWELMNLFVGFPNPKGAYSIPGTDWSPDYRDEFPWRKQQSGRVYSMASLLPLNSAILRFCPQISMNFHPQIWQPNCQFTCCSPFCGYFVLIQQLKRNICEDSWDYRHPDKVWRSPRLSTASSLRDYFLWIKCMDSTIYPAGSCPPLTLPFLSSTS